MKYFYMALVAVLIVCATSLIIASCKKEEKSDNPCFSKGSGLGASPDKTITFWISKDYGCGYLDFVSLVDSKKNDYYRFSTTDSKISVFSASTPICEAKGTVSLVVLRGESYTYTFKCSNRTFTGQFTTDCSTDCQLVEVK